MKEARTYVLVYLLIGGFVFATAYGLTDRFITPVLLWLGGH